MNPLSNVKMLLFADDIAIIPFLNDNDTNADKLFTYLNDCLNHITVWSKQWKIMFSMNKSNYVLFSRTRYKPRRVLNLCNHRIKRVESYKYLGIIFNQRGSFNEHAQHIINKARRASYIVSKLINTQYSPTPRIVRTLINSVVKSVISYGIIFYQPTKKLINTINNILIQPLHLIGGLPRNAHRLSLALEFNIPTFTIIKQQETFRFFKRIAPLPATHPSQILYNKITCNNNNNDNNNNHNNNNNNSNKNNITNWPMLNGTRVDAIKNLSTSHTALMQSKAINIKNNKNANILTATPHVLRNISHHMLANECKADKSEGIKKFIKDNMMQYYNKLDTPMYLSRDSINIARVRLRLRLNRARTNSLLHRYDKQVPSNCPLCNASYDSITHVISVCENLSTERRECYNQIFNILNINSTSINKQIIYGFIDTYQPKLQLPLLQVTAKFLSHILSMRKL